jgi:hypothetical protein
VWPYQIRDRSFCAASEMKLWIVDANPNFLKLNFKNCRVHVRQDGHIGITFELRRSARSCELMWTLDFVIRRVSYIANSYHTNRIRARSHEYRYVMVSLRFRANDVKFEYRLLFASVRELHFDLQ